MNIFGHGMKPGAEDRFIVNILRALTHSERAEAARRTFAGNDHLLDWKILVRRMSDEGVLFLFYYCIRQLHLGDLLPPEVLEMLSGRYCANLRANLMAGAMLKPVFTALNRQGTPFILLKGIALAELVYPGFGSRGISDADLLVKKEDMSRVDASLSALGYSPRDSSLNQALDNPVGYLASLDYRKSDGSLPNLHVHWHPVNTSVPAFMFAGHIDPSRLWERALPAEVANAKVRILCPEHQVIYLCEHALRINHAFDRLILAYDIFYVVRAYEKQMDWEFIVEEARRFAVSKLVFLSLTVVRRYTDLALPDEVLRPFAPDGLTLGEKAFLALELKNRRFRGSSMFVYLAMNRGLIEKGRFVFRTLFPPPHILRQRRYAKDRDVGISLYLYRIWEVLSHPFRVWLHR